MAMMKCVICHQTFNDAIAAQQVPCTGGGHMLQEVVDGTRNTETGIVADFVAPSPRELREWAEKAKKLGYDID